MPDSTSPQDTGYLTLLRQNANFRKLWSGQVVSLLGDWFSFVASATLVARLTGSGLAISGLFVMRMLPPFLVSPLAGVAADRVNRKHLLILTDLVRAVAALGFLLVRKPEHVPLLYALTGLQMAMTGFYFPARNAILPDLVKHENLGTANTLSSVTWSVMLALGAALGGLFSGRFGVNAAFVVDGITYLVSAFIVSGIAYKRKTPDGEKTPRAVLTDYLDGLRFLLRHTDNLFVAMQKGIYALAMGGAVQVAMVSLSQSVYVWGENGSTSLGLMYGVAGVGTGLGPILARRITRDHPLHLRWAMGVAYLVTMGGLLIMAPLAGFGWLLFGIFMRGLGGGTNWVFSTQLLMVSVPNPFRGRVFSTEFAFFTLAQAIGTSLGGLLCDHPACGVQCALLLVFAAMIPPAILWLLWTLRKTRHSGSNVQG